MRRHHYCWHAYCPNTSDSDRFGLCTTPRHPFCPSAWFLLRIRVSPSLLSGETGWEEPALTTGGGLGLLLQT